MYLEKWYLKDIIVIYLWPCFPFVIYEQHKENTVHQSGRIFISNIPSHMFRLLE